MNSRLVILDANIIIDAFKEGFWGRIIGFYEVHVCPIIKGEANHYLNQNGERVEIDLESYIRDGKIYEIAATTNQFVEFKNKVTDSYLNSIDNGEIEALALLISEGYDEFRFCTGDTAAIRGLGALYLGDRGVSLEELLTKVGGSLPFSPNYSKKAFDLDIARGITEQGLIIRS